MVIAVMVYHDNAGIDNQSERDGNACHGIEMDFQVEQIIENECQQYIGEQGHNDEKQIAELAAHGIDEQQQNQRGHDSPGIDFVEFLLNLLRRVVGDNYRIVLGETGF